MSFSKIIALVSGLLDAVIMIASTIDQKRIPDRKPEDNED